MCSWQSVCLRHRALLDPFKNSPHYVALTNTHMPSPALLAKSDLDSRDRKGAARQEGEHPVGAVTCFVCYLMQTVSWILSSAVIHLQELTVHFSRVRADVRQGTCPVGMDRLSTRSCEGCTKLLPPWAQWQQRPDPASSIWPTLELSCCVWIFICACSFICAWQQVSPCPRKHWNKRGFTGERFCPGGVNPRLSEVLLLRQIKPIRKPPETWAVLSLLFPPLDISCYCSCHFLWVSTGLVGGVTTAGKGFWGGLRSCQAHGEVYAIPFTGSQHKFPAHTCREGGAVVLTASQSAKQVPFSSGCAQPGKNEIMP